MSTDSGAEDGLSVEVVVVVAVVSAGVAVVSAGGVEVDTRLVDCDTVCTVVDKLSVPRVAFVVSCEVVRKSPLSAGKYYYPH